jgi:tape measure domain-containing protein
MAKTSKLIGYGISFNMKLVGGVKTAKDFEDAAKSVQKSLNRSSNSVKQHDLQLKILDKAYQRNVITQKQYDQARFSVEAKEIKRQRRLEKERRLVLGLDQQESLLAKNRQQRARMAGMAASGVSGLGLGGRAAGAARFLGGAAGLGAGAAGLGLGFIAASTVKESISAFAKLESQVTAMKSLFGEDIAEGLVSQFRSLAKSTILTNSQLIENAKIWASYGLTTEGITDRLKRLGTVAGGNSEKFRALTIAFAQVNAQGKLMGQEKNQLINAGFSLQAVADAAGISMNEFADAMKNGEITAEHLNQALINITSKGGMFFGYLEKQTETISGKLTILSGAWEEFMVALGETEQGPASAILDKMIAAAEALKDAAQYWGGGGVGPRPGQAQSFRGTGGTRQAAEGRTDAFLLGQAGSSALVDQGEGSLDERNAGIRFIQRARGISYREAAAIYDERTANLRANVEEENRIFEESLEAERKKRKEQEERDKKAREDFEAMMGTDVSDEELSRQYAATYASMGENAVRQRFEREYGMFAPEQMGGGMTMEEMGMMQQGERERQEEQRKFEEDQRRKAEEHNRQLEMDLLKAEQDRLDEQFKEEDKAIRERERKDKQMAQVPGGASFEAGSVAEFQFLKQRETESQTAIAVKEAEDRAERQREDLERRREEQMLRIEAQLEQLRQVQSGTFVGPLQDSM